MPAETASVAHRSLVGLQSLLATYEAPTGDFDSQGAWQHTYDLILPELADGKIEAQVAGSLRLCRTPANNDGQVRLDVLKMAHLSDRTWQRISAELWCRPDALGAPVRWSSDSAILDWQEKPIDATRFAESGEVHDGRIVRGGKVCTTGLSGPYTSNWSIIEALQRLPHEGKLSLAFVMLEELDLLRPRQRLASCGVTECVAGGQSLRLEGYYQVGEGILPIHYWLDEQRRVLFVVCGLNAYMLKSTQPLENKE